MARLVLHDANGPKEVKCEGGTSKWCCMCGLSKNKPLCDGSHRKTLDEEPNKTYMYDEDGSREETK